MTPPHSRGFLPLDIIAGAGLLFSIRAACRQDTGASIGLFRQLFALHRAASRLEAFAEYAAIPG